MLVAFCECLAQDPAAAPTERVVETVTITKREYEMLLLRDHAISVLAEGMTIADCSMPDMPLMYVRTWLSC
jgi:hypothetical protein